MRSVALLGILLVGCAGTPDDSATPQLLVEALDERGYDASVQPVLEHHCGSSACHGTLARGLRIYGEGGLRLPGAAGATTAAETRATYLSVIGLQPELLDGFVRTTPRTAEDAYGLTLLAKPLALERHRPGASLRKGEPAERCLTSWLVGTIDIAACTNAP